MGKSIKLGLGRLLLPAPISICKEGVGVGNNVVSSEDLTLGFGSRLGTKMNVPLRFNAESRRAST